MSLAFAIVLVLAQPFVAHAQDGKLGAQLDELAKAIERADAAAEDRSSAVHLSNMPLARFKRRKAEALAKAPFEGPARARQALDEANQALDRLKAGRVAFEGDTGHIERAYLARNDNTAQPYYVHIPDDYDPDRPWPLIVFLHGYVGYTSIIDPWVLEDEKEQVAADDGALLLTPYGRRNTDFQGVGEVDVLRSIEEMKRFYNVDPDSIYLCGPSMGGYGTWTISLRYPGMFAACAPMCGQTDMFVWWPWPHLTAPAYKQFLGEWDNPIDLAPNGVGQRYFLQHGEFDKKPLIPVEQSYMMRWEMDRLGTPIEYFEHEGNDHFIYWNLPTFEKAFSWLVQHKLDRWPKHVRLKSYNYRYDTAYWLRIVEYQRWGTPGFVEATVEGNRIDLKTDNVAQVEIRVHQNELLDPKQAITVVANGKEVFVGEVEATSKQVAVAEPLTPPKPNGLRKRKGSCGPLEDVFNGPFVLVQGTAGAEDESIRLAERVSAWCKEWDAFADGFPPVMLDTDVTDEVMAERNLVLFGTPQTNRVLAAIADDLPIKIEQDSFTIAGQTYSGPDLGLAFCYPNPKHPDRYVLVYSGEDPGRNLGINHKHDLLPDYFIFRTGPVFRHDGMFPHLCAGFFDLNWEVDPDLMEKDADIVDRYFGSAATIRDRSLKQPALKITNGFAEPLHVAIDRGDEVTLEPGESLERAVEPGRHHLAARCPDGVTRTEERLMVPEFTYEWRIPALYAAGWP